MGREKNTQRPNGRKTPASESARKKEITRVFKTLELIDDTTKVHWGDWRPRRRFEEFSAFRTKGVTFKRVPGGN